MTSVDGMNQGLIDLVGEFESARDRLNDYKAKEFPKGTVVYVEYKNRYTGYGIVSLTDGCPPNELPVRLENGNVWCYPLVKIDIGTTRPGDWPLWIKREKRIA